MTKENRQLSIFFPSSPLKFIWLRFMQTANPPQTEKKEHPSGDKRFKVLDITMKRAGYNQSALIEVLHKAQEAFGFLEEDVLLYVARALKLPLSCVYGVATFYHLFSLKPAGKHTCIVCMGTACYVKGSGKILEDIENSFDVKVGETTVHGEISLVSARCTGPVGLRRRGLRWSRARNKIRKLS
jgi:bidirectional [NiFe] hydrogenase diaphorase subunit